MQKTQILTLLPVRQVRWCNGFGEQLVAVVNHFRPRNSIYFFFITAINDRKRRNLRSRWHNSFVVSVNNG